MISKRIVNGYYLLFHTIKLELSFTTSSFHNLAPTFHLAAACFEQTIWVLYITNILMQKNNV